jgi:hypothetical protein
MKEFAMNYPVVMGNLKMMQDSKVHGTDYLYHRPDGKSSQSMSASRRRKLLEKEITPLF